MAKIKLIDFGLSCYPSFPDDGFTETPFYKRVQDPWKAAIQPYSQNCNKMDVGTPHFFSPQLTDIDPREPSTWLTLEQLKKVDVWALGIVLFELMYTRMPFIGHSIDAVKLAIRGYTRPDSYFRTQLNMGTSDYFKDCDILKPIILDIFQPVASRPSAMQLIEKYGSVLNPK